MSPSLRAFDWTQQSCEHDQSSLPESQPPAPADTAHSALLPDHITDRAELIERIKAGVIPTWSPVRKSDRYNPNHQPSNPPPLSPDSPSHPYSALHQGNFTCAQPPSSPPRFNASFSFSEESSLPAARTPPPPLRTSISAPRPTTATSPVTIPQATSPHAWAPSLSSSFIFKAPTSPLVHSSKLDASEPNSSRESSTSPPPTGAISIAASRRKSLPPSALSVLQYSPTLSRPILSTSSTSSHRRCLAETWQPSSPPSPRLRRQSTHNLSDLPPASFVGSYEESILNGRMSTAPSKPLNFLAQIGVLGLGKKCKPSLRCPSHVTLPFPAYFYSVGDYDSPSPYVGQIDLDSALGHHQGSSGSSSGATGESTTQQPSKRFPPGVGGCYRIPQRGQLQIVIKNPNKTAVKLFLVQYDLRDMEAGTKTFIRQKSYSVGTDDGDMPSSLPGKEQNQQTLRYMIHLHIVSPSRGRYYLFKNIRVVFANRVPDGKERLRNETLWPDPRYSPWKPEGVGVGAGEAEALDEGEAQRRRAASLHSNAIVNHHHHHHHHHRHHPLTANANSINATTATSTATATAGPNTQLFELRRKSAGFAIS